MNRFDWNWEKESLKPNKNVKVFSTFSCGGGSTMGYKRAGFEVVGNVEIDPRMNDLYVRNNHPRFNFCEDLREFNAREDLPEELYDLDILDGSPPCTSFSTVGVRERDWGKKKTYREGQKNQVLDDLFFVFLDTVEKLKPKIVVAENVVGLVTGKAKGYVNLIVKRFHQLGYEVQIFKLNAAHMDVPQARHRVFFIANRCGYGKIRMDFKNDPIKFASVRSAEHGKSGSGLERTLLEKSQKSDKSLADVAARLTGEKNKYFSSIIVHDDQVAPCITSACAFWRYHDKTKMTRNDIIRCQTFPADYDFRDQDVQYVCGMSVPPNMMANIAMEIYDQWLK